MRRALVALAIVVTLVLLTGLVIWRVLQPPAPLPLPPRGFVLSDVTLVEPEVGRHPHRRLAVEGAQIASIEAAKPAADDPFAGATVLPGLNDLHMHFPPPTIPGQTELWAFLFLYHGVTAVRDAADIDGTVTALVRQGISEDRFPAPRHLACGPFVDGDPPRWGNSIVARTPEEGRRAVQQVFAGDFDCIKAYDGLSEEVLAEVRAEAREHGLPVIGHVARGVPFERARLDDSQHLIGVTGWQPDERRFPFNQTKWLRLPDERIEAVIEQSLRLGLAHTPTLITTERLAAMRDYESLLREPDARATPAEEAHF